MNSWIGTLDTVGNRITQVDSEGATQYKYDSLDRLIETNYPDGTFEHFTMDIAGRRTRHENNEGITDYIYNLGDRLLSTTGARPSTSTFDVNGNIIEKETPDGSTSYFYSARDKLVEVTLPDGNSNHYSYYPESALRSETTDASSISKKFFYENSSVIEELDVYNNSLAIFVEGAEIDEHLARIQNDYVYTYITDPLGTVRNVVDASGTIINSYDYQAYGTTRNKIEAIDNDYLYTGRRLDNDTSDYYYRARYYDSDIGRFGAVDRFAPNQMTYAYVGGNPVGSIDPTGTVIWSSLKVDGKLEDKGEHAEMQVQTGTKWASGWMPDLIKDKTGKKTVNVSFGNSDLYYCHGYSLGQMTSGTYLAHKFLNFDASGVVTIVGAEFNLVTSPPNMFLDKYCPGSRPKLLAVVYKSSGAVQHTGIYNGDGTFDHKDQWGPPLEKGLSFEEFRDGYSRNVKYYNPKSFANWWAR